MGPPTSHDSDLALILKDSTSASRETTLEVRQSQTMISDLTEMRGDFTGTPLMTRPEDKSLRDLRVRAETAIREARALVQVVKESVEFSRIVRDRLYVEWTYGRTWPRSDWPHC